MACEKRSKFMKIVPINEPGATRTGRLTDMTVNKITEVLGFEPNVKDDPYKVKHSWGFQISTSKIGVAKFGIWSYKDSEKSGEFSTWGPSEILVRLFPKNYVSER
jgi:hypothetical protein